MTSYKLFGVPCSLAMANMMETENKMSVKPDKGTIKRGMKKVKQLALDIQKVMDYFDGHNSTLDLSIDYSSDTKPHFKAKIKIKFDYNYTTDAELFKEMTINRLEDVDRDYFHDYKSPWVMQVSMEDSDTRTLVYEDRIAIDV